MNINRLGAVVAFVMAAASCGLRIARPRERAFRVLPPPDKDRSSTDTYEGPVPLFSIWNPTQQIGHKPVSIKGWKIVGEVDANGRKYLRVRDPKIKPGGTVLRGYRPIHVVLVGDTQANVALHGALQTIMYEIEHHRGADFRVWQFKDGVLFPLGENNPYHGALNVDQANLLFDDTGKVVKISDCWWSKVLHAIAAAKVYDVHDDKIPTLFVRDPSNDPFASTSCGWPTGKVQFKNAQGDGTKPYGHQTLDAGEMVPDNNPAGAGYSEFRRIAQGLSQKYFEVLQNHYAENSDGSTSELQAESDFLVPAELADPNRP